MADYESLQSPENNYKQPFSSIFSSPRLFTGFVSKGSSETDSMMNSPTSILDSKPFSALINPFCSETNTPKTIKSGSKNIWEKFEAGKIGLGLIDALIDEKSDLNLLKSCNRRVLFGSQLKIQVPPMISPVNSPADSPKSPSDFGIKTRNSHFGSFSPLLSPSPVRKSPFSSSNSGFSSLSADEMELSEDYTCVISYGPNPKTTHIFDDCVVGSFSGIVKFSESRKENGHRPDRSMSYPSESFLSFCYNCKKNLGHGKDIYMYRGEKAFCSSECRDREMMLDDGTEGNI